MAIAALLLSWGRAANRSDQRSPQGLFSFAPDAIMQCVDSPRFLSGKLLLAMPGMADPRFERAVIAMCVHDENGAVGVGIGQKRAGLRFRALLKQLDLEDRKSTRL